MSKVFVYGTLKKGYHNHEVLTEESGGKFIGTTNVKDYALADLGSFPAAFPMAGSTIIGEVYEVEDLDSIDHLEGYPSFYNRIEVETVYGQAWLYFQEKPHGEVVFGGIW